MDINKKLYYPTSYDLNQTFSEFCQRKFVDTFAQSKGLFLTKSIQAELAEQLSVLLFDDKDIELIRDYAHKTNSIGALSGFIVTSKDENFDETITSLDMSVNELRNAKFQIQSPEKDLICRFLEIPTTTEDTKNLTTTEIQQYLSGFALSIKLNNNAIGKALTSLKYRKIRSATTTKYAVKYKDSFD